MATVREMILAEIEYIQDDGVLDAFYSLLVEARYGNEKIHVTKPQRDAIAEARADYAAGRYYTSKDLFAELNAE